MGLTPKQLRENITKIYSKEFIDPVVTVTMIEYNRTIDRLKKAITTAARGQSKLTTIRPDGYISFPVITDVLAEGKTLPYLKEVVQKKYQEQIDNLTVTMILKVMKANVAYIFGEVRAPNTYLMDKNLTVSQLVSRAGGLLRSAEESTVLVISRDKKRRPWGRLVNLEQVIHDGDISKDILLQQYDIVYVPRTEINRRNLWVREYIQNMIPTNLISPYEVGGQLINGNVIQHDPLIK